MKTYSRAWNVLLVKRAPPSFFLAKGIQEHIYKWLYPISLSELISYYYIQRENTSNFKVGIPMILILS